MAHIYQCLEEQPGEQEETKAVMQGSSNPPGMHDREGTGFEEKEGREETQRNRVKRELSGTSELQHSLPGLGDTVKTPNNCKVHQHPHAPHNPCHPQYSLFSR